MSKELTKEQSRLKQDYTIICISILQTMADVGPAPLGVCYAALMGRIDLETFNGLVGCLVRAGLATLIYLTFNLGSNKA